MPTLWIALLAITTAAPSSQADDSAPAASPLAVASRQDENEKPAAQPLELSSEQLRKRTGRELLAAVREALARLADPPSEHLEAAAEELLFVYDELREDRELAGSLREYYTRKVGSRLKQVSDELTKRIARNKRLGKPKPPDRILGPEEVNETLAQRAGQAAPPAPQPARRSAVGGRQPMPSDDYGQHLVDLIQKTVAPSSWDVNGGPGTIYYWRPGRALVVRQRGEVHEETGGLLDQLRRAGQ